MIRTTTLLVFICVAVTIIVTGLVASLGLIGVREEKIAELQAKIQVRALTHQESLDTSYDQIKALQGDRDRLTNENRSLEDALDDLKVQLDEATERLNDTKEKLEIFRPLVADVIDATANELRQIVDDLKDDPCIDPAVDQPTQQGPPQPTEFRGKPHPPHDDSGADRSPETGPINPLRPTVRPPPIRSR